MVSRLSSLMTSVMGALPAMTAATVATAVYEPAYARVRLNLSGFASGTEALQVVRRDLDTGKTALVRGARSVAIINPGSDAVQLYDYEFTAGHLTRYEYYQFPDVTAYLMTPSVGATYDVTRVWLKSITRPYLSRQVRVGSFTPYEHLLRADPAYAVRRSVGVAGGDVRAGRRFTLRLKLDQADVQDLDNLLAVGGTWLYQRPGGDVGLPRQAYVQPTRAQEALRGRANDGARWLDLTLEEVGPPDADIVAAAVSWGNITPQYASWSALGVAYASWADVLAVVADPAEVVVT